VIPASFFSHPFGGAAWPAQFFQYPLSFFDEVFPLILFEVPTTKLARAVGFTSQALPDPPSLPDGFIESPLRPRPFFATAAGFFHSLKQFFQGIESFRRGGVSSPFPPFSFGAALADPNVPQAGPFFSSLLPPPLLLSWT